MVSLFRLLHCLMAHAFIEMKIVKIGCSDLDMEARDFQKVVSQVTVSHLACRVTAW